MTIYWSAFIHKSGLTSQPRILLSDTILISRRKRNLPGWEKLELSGRFLTLSGFWKVEWFWIRRGTMETLIEMTKQEMPAGKVINKDPSKLYPLFVQLFRERE
jgi:hypothetical protein